MAIDSFASVLVIHFFSSIPRQSNIPEENERKNVLLSLSLNGDQRIRRTNERRTVDLPIRASLIDELSSPTKETSPIVSMDDVAMREGSYKSFRLVDRMRKRWGEAKMVMESSRVTLNDLPDEMLLMILRKLSHTDVLYSFYGVNERFTQLVHDPVFTRHLTCVQPVGEDKHRHLASNQMLHRLCSEVLPSIADRIRRFDLDLSMVKEIFHGRHYPNLSHLTLYNITDDLARSLLSGRSTPYSLKREERRRFLFIQRLYI